VPVVGDLSGGYRPNNVWSRGERLRDVNDHVHEVGASRRIGRTTRTRAEHDTDLGDDTRSSYILPNTSTEDPFRGQPDLG
jgi:hypothetical protein